MPRKKKLSNTDKEVLLQTYAVTGSKAETARRCGVSQRTVYKVLGEAEQADPTTKAARADAAVKLSNKVQLNIEEILDSINDVDIESGRITLRDKENKIVGYKYFGPSLVQKATAVGILTDKTRVLQEYEKGLMHDTQSGDLMLPGDIEGLIGAIRGKVSSLKVLNVQFERDNPDLVRETQEMAGEIARIEAEEAQKPEIITFDEFDSD